MIAQIFKVLEQIDSFFWSYIGFTLVVLSGVYISHKSKWFQFRVLFSPRKTFRELKHSSAQNDKGTHPFKLYFASIGGMVGIGNIVAVITALMIGGPGALFWLWLAAFCGMIIKYSEIYLGVHYRVPNQENGYDGGPMYYLPHAFQSSFLKKYVPLFAAFLLCIYGVEIYQFSVIVDTLSTTFQAERLWVMGILVALTFYTAFGGVKRLANVCTFLMPFFMISYVLMCGWVVVAHAHMVPNLLYGVLQSAFGGTAAVGGFVGGGLLLAAQHGISRAVYSGDIGIGYDSIIQSETKSQHPERQARMAIFAMVADSFICTLSMLVVLLSGLDFQAEGIKASEGVTSALAMVFPTHIKTFMAFFIFTAGWTTILAYLVIGAKSARFLSPKYGFVAYLIYAVCAFAFFSFVDQSQVYLIMTLSGGMLITLNLFGILRLRKHIVFK